jgi:hypothetical protein
MNVEFLSPHLRSNFLAEHPEMETVRKKNECLVTAVLELEK